jgi:hypothetical protein
MSSPWRVHKSIQRWENMPWRAARTLSPGDSVLVTAASQPPVPVAGKMITSLVRVFKMRLTPSTAGLNASANRFERWSIVGTSMARRRRSGMLVGPGMKTGFWVDMDHPPSRGLVARRRHAGDDCFKLPSR